MSGVSCRVLVVSGGQAAAGRSGQASTVIIEIS